MRLTDGNPDGAEHHANETILGIGFSTLGHHLRTVALLETRGHKKGTSETNPYGDKG